MRERAGVRARRIERRKSARRRTPLPNAARLRALEIDESRHDEIAAMSRRIAQGIAELDRGEGIAGDEARWRSAKCLAARPGRRRGAA